MWDGWNLLEERRGDGSIKRCYVYGAGQNELVQAYEGGVGKLWYWQDGRGNTAAVSGDAGFLVERYRYDLVGNPSFYDANNVPRPSANDTRFLFAGSLYQPETGLYDMRNRFYHPTLSRFLQTDPIGFKGDALNLYRYCGNDFVDRTDPDGLRPTGGDPDVRRPTLPPIQPDAMWGMAKGTFGADFERYQQQVGQSVTMAPMSRGGQDSSPAAMRFVPTKLARDGKTVVPTKRDHSGGDYEYQFSDSSGRRESGVGLTVFEA